MLFAEVGGGPGGSNGGGNLDRSHDIWKYHDDDFCKCSACPRCGDTVFFVRHNGGSVWFDDLGQPWAKHGCFDDDKLGEKLRRLLINNLRPNTVPTFGIVRETEIRRPNTKARIAIQCSDGLMIDQHFVFKGDLSRLPGSLVVILDDNKGGFSLRFLTKDFRVHARVENRVLLRFESKDCGILDAAVSRITTDLQVIGGIAQGPFPLPTRQEEYSVLFPGGRRKYTIVTHKRLLVLVNAHSSIFAKIGSSELPPGVSLGLRETTATIVQDDD